jgi:serine protease Do
MYGIPVGVYVSEVSDDGAAKEAGIQVGDIITAINGVETSSKEALIEKVHSYRIGTEITITLQRSSNGKYKEMEVTAVLKDAGTIEGLSGSDESSDSQNSGNSGSNDKSGNSGNSGNSGSNGNSGSSGSSGNSGDNGTDGSSGDDYGYYYYGDDGNSSAQDFYEFFNDFFN